MAEESIRRVQGVVRLLQGHFPDLRLPPPADEDQLDELEDIGVPADALALWRVCDGIEVPLDDSPPGLLFDAAQAMERYPITDDHDELERLLPIRSDGCGNYDCLLVDAGPGEGAVVFWDHEMPDVPQYPLGGSLVSYLEMWASYLLAIYEPNGRMKLEARPPRLDEWPFVGEPLLRHPWPFDLEWMSRHDPESAAMLADPELRAWLGTK